MEELLSCADCGNSGELSKTRIVRVCAKINKFLKDLILPENFIFI